MKQKDSICRRITQHRVIIQINDDHELLAAL
ncbi:hypothetical protein FHS86_002737 [Roseimarinus sediminis]|jgi:hypothetical protein